MIERVIVVIGVFIGVTLLAAWPFIRYWWSNRCPKCWGRLTILTSDEMIAVMKSQDMSSLSQMCGSVALRCRGRCQRCYSRTGVYGRREIYLTALDVDYGR